MAKEVASSSEPENNDEMEQITIARALSPYCLKEKVAMANSPNSSLPFHKKFPSQVPRPTSPQHPPITTSKILPLICPRTVTRNNKPSVSLANDNLFLPSQTPALETHGSGHRPHIFPAPGAAPYVPSRQMRVNCRGIAPPVTIRTAVPVFSAPPRPMPPTRPPIPMQASPVHIAPSVCVRQVVPVFAAPPARKDLPPVKKEEAQTLPCPARLNQPIINAAKGIAGKESSQGTEAAQILDQLKI